MRLLVLVVLLAACGGKPEPMPPKRPNTELIVGEFERHPPEGTTAMRFVADGTFVVAKDKAALDVKDGATTGTYKLDGDMLTFTNEQGSCADAENTKVA